MSKRTSKRIQRNELNMPVVDNILELQSVYEVLLQAVELTSSDNHDNEALQELSKSFHWARDKIIAWNVRKSMKELDATIAMLSAKIKSIQFMMGQCDGVELHQVCSLALVYFSNILEDAVVYNKSRNDGRKTLRDISKMAQLPAWLSHYRNTICHEITASPCSNILSVLVDKSMRYMERSYWSPVLEFRTFNAVDCHNSMNFIVNDRGSPKLTNDSGKKLKKVKDKSNVLNQQLDSKTDYKVWCGQQTRKSHIVNLKTMFRLHKQETIEVLIEFLERDSIRNTNRKNMSTLFKMLFLNNGGPALIDQLITKIQADKQNKKRTMNWLSKFIGATCLVEKESRKEAFKKLGMTQNDIDVIKHIKSLTPLKCSRIAYRLVHLQLPIVRRLLMKMRRSLVKILGLERTKLLIQMTRMVLRDNSDVPMKNKDFVKNEKGSVKDKKNVSDRKVDMIPVNNN